LPSRTQSGGVLYEKPEGETVASFEHPLNGHVQKVTFLSNLAVLLIGPIYLALKGMWGHFWLYLLLTPFTAFFGVWIWYTLFVGGYVKEDYLKKGYRVTGFKPPQDKWPSASE
jgi:hypothetical protein